MPLLPFRIPPGVSRNGTEYQSAGRWFDADLVRWIGNITQPIKGWVGFGHGHASVSSSLLRSHELGTAPWTVGLGGVVMDEDVQNHFDPSEATIQATKVTDDGTVAAAHVTQTVGVLTAAAETLSFVLEKVSGATVTDIEIRDATAGAAVIRARLTWSTFAVAVNDSANGTSDTVRLRRLGTGPLGGPLVRLIATATPTVAGNVRTVRFYPTGISSAQAGVIVVHQAQLVEDDEPGDLLFPSTVPVTLPQDRVAVDSPVSGMLAWRDNDDVQRLAVGTTHQVWAYADGVLDEITPASLVGGQSRAIPQSGVYGTGAYGTGVYGSGDESLEQLEEAQSWQFDTFGDHLVASALSDGKLYEWDLNGSNQLVAITNAPVDNLGLVVTPERFLFALGAGGESRRVEWCDQEDDTIWTPASTNQAGGEHLPGQGPLMAGRRGRRETLLWSSTDMFVAQYVGGTGVYSFRMVGNACGPISRQSMSMIDSGRAVWMGESGFFIYNGSVLPMESEVHDYVFNGMNRQQRSQIWSMSLALHNEVWWFYPSSTSLFCDRYVSLNMTTGVWGIGALQRSAGIDSGIYQYPLMADRFGVVYEHERGTDMNTFLCGSQVPYAQSGPVQIAHGDNWVHVSEIIPDEATLGSVSLQLAAKAYPTAEAHQVVAYNPANPTSTRVSGRAFTLRATQVLPDWRLGEPRFDVELEGMR